MTLTDGRLDTDDEGDILDALVADAKEYFGDDLNDDQLAAIRFFYRPIAARLAEAQDDLRVVLNSAQLEYAQGQALDLLTGLIGVKRNPATTASGTAVFERDTRTHKTYTIQDGTEIQTDDSDPVVFETTEARTLPLLADFESGDLPQRYDGDRTSASVQNTTVLDGNYTLELDATQDAEVYDDTVRVRQGMTVHYYTQCETNTAPIFTFGKEDEVTYYQLVTDHGSDRVAIEVITDGGTPETVVEDTSAGLVAGERLDVEIEWDLDGTMTVAVFDGNNAEITEITGSDTTISEGYIGFKSGDSNGRKWFDYVTTSRTPVPIEAVEAGPDGNVGRNALIVMSDPPTGIESVTNPQGTDGGSERENDDELRARANTELSQGSRASASALVSKVLSINGVTSVSLFTINQDGDGSNDGFELVIEGGNDADIAQTILETMAAGDTSFGGVNGEAASAAAELPNDQTLTIEFSRPDEITISISADLTITDTYAGDNAVRDAIVDYIGGQYSSGNDANGLGAGDDVIWTEVLTAIHGIEGVHDIQNLTVDTPSTTDNTDNIAIADNEVATADGTDASITFTTTEQ